MKHPIIDIVAPAAGCHPNKLQEVAAFVQSLGFTPRFVRGIVSEDAYHSQTPEYRATDLKTALEATDSVAIWALRGGEGTNQTLPALHDVIIPPGKIVIGLSDISNLLNVSSNLGASALHAPPAYNYIATDKNGQPYLDASARRALQDALFTAKSNVTQGLTPVNAAAAKPFTVEAQGAGGCISVLESAIGTPYALQSQQRIVILEDVGESVESVRLMLRHLSETNALAGVHAIIFGDFDSVLKPMSPTERDAMENMLRAFAAGKDVPVFIGAKGFGHTAESIPVFFDRIQLQCDGREATLQSLGQAQILRPESPAPAECLLRGEHGTFPNHELAAIGKEKPEIVTTLESTIAEEQKTSLISKLHQQWRHATSLQPLAIDVEYAQYNLGTKHFPDLRGRHVILENPEATLRPYQINRTLVQMEHAGLLSNAASVSIGDMGQRNANDQRVLDGITQRAETRWAILRSEEKKPDSQLEQSAKNQAEHSDGRAA